MNIDIITPEKKVYSNKAKLVQLPGEKGLFEILENHAPVISSLGKGKIKIVDDDDKVLLFDIESGVVECRSNKISILVSYCVQVTS